MSSWDKFWRQPPCKALLFRVHYWLWMQNRQQRILTRREFA